VLWNTVYMQAALDYLSAQGEVIKEDDEARLSLLGRKHINFLGHFSFMLPKVVAEGQLRPLNLGRIIIRLFYNARILDMYFTTYNFNGIIST
jgi:hypothetical protein